MQAIHKSTGAVVVVALCVMAQGATFTDDEYNTSFIVNSEKIEFSRVFQGYKLRGLARISSAGCQGWRYGYGAYDITVYTQDVNGTDVAQVEFVADPDMDIGAVYCSEYGYYHDIHWKVQPNFTVLDFPHFHWFIAVFYNSPLHVEFWDDPQHGEVIDHNWLKSLTIHMTGATFNSSWISKLRSRTLKHLEITGNSWGSVKDLHPQLPMLEHLNLARNSIQHLPQGTLKSYLELKYVNLSHNDFSSDTTSLLKVIFLAPRQIKTIDISFNQIRELRSFCAVIWDSVDLSHNSFSSIPKLNTIKKVIINLDTPSTNMSSQILFRDCSLYLPQLKLPYNNMSTISSNLKLLSTNLPCYDDLMIETETRNMAVLNISGNPIRVIEMERVRIEDIQFLDLSWNSITYINKSAFHRFSKLKGINLSHNSMFMIHGWNFVRMETLETIDLSYNNLNAIYVRLFADLTLTNLDLSNNNLTKVKIFGSIHFLDMSSNLISELTTDKVLHVNLSYNSLKGISEHFWISLQEMDMVDLGGNDFRCCSTDGTHTEKTFTELKIAIYNLNTTKPFTCILNDEQPSFLLFDTWHDTSICAHPFINYILYLGIFLGIGVLLILFQSIFWRYMHYHRAELAFISQMNRMKTEGLEQDEACAPNCCYDAFVCHSSKDYPWVLRYLLPNIERKEEEDYKLCVHCRDFELGSQIDENILYAIRKSRKVVLIVSKAFLKSRWCKLELNMIRYKMIQEDRNYIILIVVQKIPRRDLPLALRYLMDTRTYLEWPRDLTDEYRITRCWELLRDVLGESLAQRRQREPPPTEEGRL